MITPSINAQALKAMLSDGGELALIDVREAGQFGESHLLFAVPVPYSRLELDMPRLVPRQSVRMALCDDGVSGVAQLAAKRLGALGYSNVAILKDGTSGWQAAGYVLYAGVNVPSKTFGELVEHAYHTPHVSCTELIRMRAAGEDVIVFDGRTWDEYQKMTIPGSTSCPNAELPLRIHAFVKNPKTTIVVNCAGRTRSIMGAQTLINFGIPNPVYALENGTQGWVLSGGELERGAKRKYPTRIDTSSLSAQQAAAQRLMERHAIPRVSASQVQQWLNDGDRTTFLLDVRTPEEYAAGTAPGAVHAPGGQLIQATDAWVGVRNARLVLLDGEGVRAPVVASWLKQLGCDVYVLSEGAKLPSPPGRRAGDEGERQWLPAIPSITPHELQAMMKNKTCTIIDLGPSMNFRKAHIAGSIWSIRPRIAEAAADLKHTVVLVSDYCDVAQLAAMDLRDAGHPEVRWLEGGLAAWIKAGFETATSPHTPPDCACIDYLFFVHDRHAGNQEAMKQYLAWETGLVGQLDEDERRVFKLAADRPRFFAGA